jgi:hypothetical protein
MRTLPIGPWTTVGFLISLLFASHASALETVVADRACHLDGLIRPLRQTIVVIDQSSIIQIGAGDNIGAANRIWLNAILTIAGVQEGQASVISAPRERVTVIVAREDGGDLIRVFTGCAPTYSQDEIAEMKKSSVGLKGGIDWFVGRGVETRIENERNSFRSQLTSALAELPKMSRPKSSISSESFTPPFLGAFSLLAGTIDLGEGIPRLFVFSSMKAKMLGELTEAKAARGAGFDLAAKIGGDLQRAEVYVSGVSNDSGRYSRDFIQAFFLGIKGRVSGFSGETLPPVAEPPQMVQVFGGTVDYGAGVKVPMQIRLATDRSGSLVNSWIEVTVKQAVATPLTGKVVCKNPESCEVTGDGKEFAQSWVLDPGLDQMQKFDASLPFSGVRYFEFTTSASVLKGRAYDPLVTSINGRKELLFELSRTPNVKF